MHRKPACISAGSCRSLAMVAEQEIMINFLRGVIFLSSGRD